MRKKTWIGLVLALAICLGTLGVVFAGDFATFGDQDGYLGGHPDLPAPVVTPPISPDELLTMPLAAKYAVYGLWLMP